MPVVSPGLASYEIHHAASDERILGIPPGFVAHINARVLTDVDGPMLKHGLQETNQCKVCLPAAGTCPTAIGPQLDSTSSDKLASHAA